MRGGGEYGEMTIALAAHNTPVTAAERDELLALLEAMSMPTDPIGKLNVQDEPAAGLRRIRAGVRYCRLREGMSVDLRCGAGRDCGHYPADPSRPS